MATTTMAFPAVVNPGDPGRGPLIIGLLWTFTIAAVFLVALRFFIRWRLGRMGWGWDDWLMLIATIFQVLGQSFLTVSYHYGFGKPSHSLQMPDQLTIMLKWNWVGIGPGQATSILARISITISLVFLFGVHKWLKWFLIIFAAIQTIVGIVEIVITYTQVVPVYGLWDIFNPNVTYRDPTAFINVGYLCQSLYTFADLTYVLFPVIIIWRLNMPTHRKIGLIIIMMASIFTMAMSIMKLVNLHWQGGGDSNMADALDAAYLLVLYAGLEQTCVIIMGCIPSLRGLRELNFCCWGRERLLPTTIAGTKSSRTAVSNSYVSDVELAKHEAIQGAGGYTWPRAHDGGCTLGNAVSLSNHPERGSNESLVASDHIRCTQRWAVTYSKPPKNQGYVA
ncbi:hypothetical protein HIM_06186 [Hirsutella minnesotensis 3608]|uniref:Rhodopsin domain-containing protein n=1 Tax=Hirsutella minnesotensis 3608 TaxID=1043627 RepID=A0A0F7ZJG6_9HYPO|nr:hypothetical protein HIM_06186 [Hirsutella minnesotensis 3608]